MSQKSRTPTMTKWKLCSWF